MIYQQPVYIPATSSQTYYQQNQNYCKYCNGSGYKSNGKKCVCNGGHKSSRAAIALGTVAAVGLGLALFTKGKKHH